MDKANKAVQDQVTAAKMAKSNPGVKLVSGDRRKDAAEARAMIAQILNQYECVALPELSLTSFGISRATIKVLPKEDLEKFVPPISEGAIKEKE